MKYSILFIWLNLLFVFPLVAGAHFKFEDHRESRPPYSGGTGANFSDIKVFSTEAADRNLVYFVEFDSAHRRLSRMSLPTVTSGHKCEFRESISGSIGDYKPARLEEGLRIAWTGGSVGFLINRDGFTSVLPNPHLTTRKYSGLTGLVTPEAVTKLTEICASPARSLYFFFSSQAVCKWNGQGTKPSAFPDDILFDAGGAYFNTKLICR